MTPDLAELRRLLDCASELPWEYYRPHYASGYHSITDSGGQLVAIEADEYDAELIAAETRRRVRAARGPREGWRRGA